MKPQLTDAVGDKQQNASHTEIPVPFHEKPSARRQGQGRYALYALLVYAGAITAALIVAVTLGAVHLNTLKRQIEDDTAVPTPTPTPTEEAMEEYTEDGDRYYLDPKANREVIFLSGEGLNDSIMVIDHDKDLIGWSIPSTNGCYMISGVDERLPNARELAEHFKNGQIIGEEDEGSEEGDEDEDTLLFTSVPGGPAGDISMWPRELLSPCWGKSVYWMEKADPDALEAMARWKKCWQKCWSKWGIRLCVEVCVSVGFGK